MEKNENDKKEQLRKELIELFNSCIKADWGYKYSNCNDYSIQSLVSDLINKKMVFVVTSFEKITFYLCTTCNYGDGYEIRKFIEVL